MIAAALRLAVVTSLFGIVTAASASEPTMQVPQRAIDAFADRAYDSAGDLAFASGSQCVKETPLDPKCLEVLKAATRYLVAARRFEEAAQAGRLALAIAEERFGKDSREAADALLALGPAEGGLNNPGIGAKFISTSFISTAVTNLEKADPESPALANALAAWAAAEDTQQFTYSDQEARHREAIRIATATLGEKSANLAPYYLGLGRNLHGQGRLEDAEAAYRKGLALVDVSPISDGLTVQSLYAGLGETLLQLRPDEAVPVLRRALALDVARPREDPWLRVEPIRALADLLVKTGELDEAEELLNRADGFARSDSRRRADESLLALTRGRLLDAKGEFASAEAVYGLADQKLAQQTGGSMGLYRAYEIHRALGQNLFKQGKLAQSLAAFKIAQSDLEFVGFIENNPVQSEASGDVGMLRTLTGGDPGLARDELRLSTDRAIKSAKAVARPRAGTAAIRRSREYFKALVAANWKAARTSVPPVAE